MNKKTKGANKKTSVTTKPNLIQDQKVVRKSIYKLRGDLTLYLIDFFGLEDNMQFVNINKLFRATIESKRSFNVKWNVELLGDQIRNKHKGKITIGFSEKILTTMLERKYTRNEQVKYISWIIYHGMLKEIQEINMDNMIVNCIKTAIELKKLFIEAFILAMSYMKTEFDLIMDLKGFELNMDFTIKMFKSLKIKNLTYIINKLNDEFSMVPNISILFNSFEANPYIESFKIYTKINNYEVYKSINLQQNYDNEKLSAFARIYKAETITYVKDILSFIVNSKSLKKVEICDIFLKYAYKNFKRLNLEQSPTNIFNKFRIKGLQYLDYFKFLSFNEIQIKKLEIKRTNLYNIESIQNYFSFNKNNLTSAIFKQLYFNTPEQVLSFASTFENPELKMKKLIFDNCNYQGRKNFNDYGWISFNLFGEIICPSINKLILNESLVHLTLSNCGIGNEQLIMLGSVFKINSTIKSLNLSGNLFDSALNNFIDILLQNSKLPLNSLDLSFNRIDKLIFTKIADLIIKYKGFTSLNIATRLAYTILDLHDFIFKLNQASSKESEALTITKLNISGFSTTKKINSSEFSHELEGCFVDFLIFLNIIKIDTLVMEDCFNLNQDEIKEVINQLYNTDILSFNYRPKIMFFIPEINNLLSTNNRNNAQNKLDWEYKQTHCLKTNNHCLLERVYNNK